MTPLNFAIVGLRLLGIYFIVESGPLFAMAGLLGAYLKQLSQDAGFSQSTLVFSSLIPAGLQVFIGLLLFIFSVPLARRLTPEVTDESKKVACSFEEVQAIAFAVAGILILASALPSVGHAWQNLYNWYNMPQQEPASVNVLREYLMYPLGILAQIVIGLALLLNPRGFRNIWHWLRTAGTHPST